MKYKTTSFLKSSSFKLLALISFLIGYVAAILHSGDMDHIRQELVMTGAIFTLFLALNYLTNKSRIL